MPLDLEKARELFLHAVGNLPPERWDEYVAEGCGGDAELERQVSHLLQVHREAGSFLESPAVALGDTGDDRTSAELPTGEAQGSPVAQTGTIIGPYKLLQPIGEGGMGTVYMAEQTQPVRRTVALKLIKAGMDSRQVLARFGAERQALALMDHSNIAKVLDAGATEQGRPYFVMELVKGIPITRFCDERRLTLRERLELAIPVCQAVQHAHQKGIIHRDLKPSNVLVALYDGKPVPKVIDFGVAKATGPRLTDQTLYTEFGAVVGTLEYMSPEQAELNQLDIDTRSDIYSLGVLLYELLTGSTPLEHKRIKGAVLLELLRVIREEESPRPSHRLSTTEELPSIAACRNSEPRKLRGLVRGELDWIVMKALEKDRNRRYETANGLAADLRRYLDDEPVQACPPSAWYRLRKFVRRNKIAISTALLIASVLVGGTAVSTWQAIRATRAEGATRVEADKATAINEFLVNDLLMQAQPWKNAASEQITLQEVLDRAAETVGSRFHTRPLLEAAMRSTIGGTYPYLDAWNESRRQYAAALDIYQREKGPWAAETANAMYGLGYALFRVGDLSRAEPMIRQALEVLRRVRGPEHPDTLNAMWLLSELMDDQGKHAEAETLCARTLEVRRRIQGAEHPETMEHTIRLAVIYSHQGKWSQAEELVVKSQELCRRVMGEDHTVTDWCTEELVKMYRAQGKLSEAERIWTTVLETRRRVHGEDHSRTYRAMKELMSLYSGQGKLSQAEPLANKLLEVTRRVLGEGRPRTSGPLRDLGHGNRLWGFGLWQAGRLQEAEQVFREALAVFEKLTTEFPGRNDHWHFLADTHRQIGRLLADRKRLEEAEKAYRQAIEIHQQNAARFPDQSVNEAEWAACYFNLGALLAATGRLPEANDLYRKGIEISPRSGKAHNNLAWMLATAPDPDIRDPARAVELAKNAVALAPIAGTNWNTLGAAHYRAGDWNAAIDALTKSMELRNGGDSNAWFFLAMAYWQIGDKSHARSWYDKAVPWMEKNHSKDEELRRFRAEAAALLDVKEKKD